ncbi:MAG: ABC transporter ATP-binding protein [Bryobacteraceae bacterium]|nr:ABC transporter ATP-binding protein [Bryobacteraceae bacterium]
MRDRITEALWERAQLPHLMEALGARAGLSPRHGRTPKAPGPDPALAAWFESAAAILGLEAAPMDMRGFRVEQTLRAAAPAVIPMEQGSLALLEAGARFVTLLRPDLSTVRVGMDKLRRRLCHQMESPHREEAERLMEECGIAASRRGKAVEAMLRERTRYQVAGVAYALRRPPGAGFLRTARTAGLTRDVAMLLAAHSAEYLLLVASWWVLGRGVLQGRIDSGVMAAWALLLASLIPFRIAAAWLQGRIAIGFGGLLRERLLDGALKLRPDEVKHEGAGAFLGRAIEAEQVETMAISGGVLAGLTMLEVMLSLALLIFGSGDLMVAAALALWLGIAGFLARRYYSLRMEWTDLRLRMTGDLIEAMTGHRTRLAQQPPEEWHEEEDRALGRYLAVSKEMDTVHARLMGGVPRGYLVTSLMAMAPEFLAVAPSTPKLAVSLGAVIIAWQAFRRMAGGLAQLCGAAISWRSVADLFHASAREEDGPAAAEPSGEAEMVLSARDVSFQYAAGGRLVFSGVSVDIRPGDWLLLEGASGGGKSTLVSVLTGLRRPTGGLILAGGLDLQTLGGRQWRRRIAAAPQYHENHVLGNTFGFNLLMGRGWPAKEADLREAEEVCRELGLGPLLERMPGGLFQMVGETGWQLSQGERSRLFLARALLQKPELVVLDESFAALDPENLRQALECTLRRARTLVVVAHP